MARRALIAGIIAAVSIGSLALSIDASARPGGGGAFGARGGGGFVGGFHRGSVQPFVRGGHFRGHVGRRVAPHAHHGKHGPHHGKHGLHHGKRGFHHGKHGRLHDRRDIGLGLPFGAVGYIDGTVPAAAYGPGSVAPNGIAPNGAVFYRHVCRSDVQVVPSGTRGEAEVTVTRCYVVAD
jgi:hypothetical protein